MVEQIKQSAEHFAEDVSNSSATDARSTNRVPAERIKHAEDCGKACGRLLIGMCADFPADFPTRLRASHYVLIRDRRGTRPQNGIAVFNQWCDIEPLRSRASGIFWQTHS